MAHNPHHPPDRHLREEALTSETLLQGHFLQVRRDQVVLPDGSRASREYVVHPGAVVVVALLPDGQVVLERQFRYPVGQVMVEFPAGKLDAGESPLACGKRELQEETGYTATHWARAGTMHLAVAYSTEVIHVYFAQGLITGPRQLDAGEHLDVFAAAPSDVLQGCLSGTITDAKTLACAVWLQQFVAGNWVPVWEEAPAGEKAPT